MELQITALIENEQDDDKNLSYEHGLSLYIEFEGKKILFDTGQTGAFLDNALYLGKKIEEIDFLLVSHGHYDHSGGVPALIKYLQKQNVGNRMIPMLVGEEFFTPKYKKKPDGTWHYNGNPFTLNELPEDIVSLKKITDDVTFVSEHIFVFKNFMRYTDYEELNPRFFVRNITEGSEQYKQDGFQDEIVLGLLTSKGLVLIAGCSHVGIVNIVESVIRRTNLPIYAVLGGTHLVEAKEERLRQTVQAFKMHGISQVAVSHCTGEAGVTLLKMEFGDGFIRNNTGNVYRV